MLLLFGAGLGLILLPPLLLGQAREPRNPMARDPHSLKLGEAYFRAKCASCHGLDAHGGGQGPDLTLGGEVHTATDAQFYATITQGIAGTGMPGTDLSDEQAWLIIAFVRSLSAARNTASPGDIAQGKSIFLGKGNCASCHMVNGAGGRLGPDLSRVGASRSARALTESIRTPNKDLSDGMDQLGALIPAPMVYDTVTVTTLTGQRLIGVAKNEDNFSLQLMDVSGELHLFLKSDLQAVIHEHKSLMPAYDENALSAGELRQLLAYLQSLRGTVVQGTTAASVSATHTMSK